MSTKIQLRRDTYAHWHSVNPKLSSGEIGFETDTGKFKIGTGSAFYNDLDYAAPLPTFTGITTALGYTPVDTADFGSYQSSTSTDITNAINTAEGYTDTVVGALTTTDIPEGTGLYFTDERAQDAIGNNLGTGLSYNDPTGAISVNTSTIQTRVANVSDTEIGYLDGVTSAIQTQINNILPSQTGNGNKFLKTNGTSVSWVELPSSLIGPLSLTTNDPFIVDQTILDGIDLIEYTVYIKQGTLYRASKILILTSGTEVSSNEYAISEIGGFMDGVSVTAALDGGTAIILQVQILDASTSNASIRLIKNLI